MIPKQEQFIGLEPKSGTIDEILNNTIDIDTENVDHCYEEIMNEFGVSKEEAMLLFLKAKNEMVQNVIDVMLNEGLICISGKNENGEPLYNLPVTKKKKKTKKNK
jgi:hypothetical protein